MDPTDDFTGNANPPANPRLPIIYVRSRIEDMHGHRWVTDVQDDDYVYVETQPQH